MRKCMLRAAAYRWCRQVQGILQQHRRGWHCAVVSSRTAAMIPVFVVTLIIMRWLAVAMARFRAAAIRAS